MVVYRRNTATRERLGELLWATDQSFVPPLSSRVDIDSYVGKLIDHAVLVEAWDGPVLVGVIATYLNDPANDCGFISNVCVRQAYGGQGVATELLRQTIEEAVRGDFPSLQLEVGSANVAARAFYSKNGFSVMPGSTDPLVMEIETNVAGLSERQDGASS